MPAFQETVAEALADLAHESKEPSQSDLEQLKAAEAENKEIGRNIAATARMRKENRLTVEENRPLTDLCRAYCMAAFRLSIKRCEHLVTHPIQPAWIVLPARLQLCETCWHLLSPEELTELEIIAEAQCDLCEEDHEYFRPIMVSLAMLNLVGNVCDSCFEILARNG